MHRGKSVLSNPLFPKSFNARRDGKEHLEPGDELGHDRNDPEEGKDTAEAARWRGVGGLDPMGNKEKSIGPGI